jgi:hypothetical protein
MSVRERGKDSLADEDAKRRLRLSSSVKINLIATTGKAEVSIFPESHLWLRFLILHAVHEVDQKSSV